MAARTVPTHGSMRALLWFSCAVCVLCAKLVPKLNSKTLWRLQITLKGKYAVIETQSKVRFIEEPGFEPPSGKIFVETDPSGLLRCDEKGFTANWQLGEDKDDRKDGLWIWGLFAEPKYPFIYFTLPVWDTVVQGEEAEERPLPFDIPNSRLLCRFNHEYDAVEGVKLSSSTLSLKRSQVVKADPLGLGGNVNVGEEEVCGTVTLTPISEELERLTGSR